MSAKGSDGKVRKCKSAKVGRNRLSKIISPELIELKKKQLYRTPVCISSSTGPKIKINGQTYIDYSSNDYLNISCHPAIMKAAAGAIKKYGFGSGASRLLSGTYTPHQELEKRIAKFKNTEASLIFNTGYAANTGIIPVLAGNDAVVFSDELNHASIVDGIRLSKARALIYRHKDVNHLEEMLRKISKSKSIKRRLIITDTVFSMDGDIAPLNEIVFLSEKYKAILMIDDAHATGVLGKSGRGALEYFGISAANIIQMGTLSKAFGCFGAYAAGRKEMVELLINRARSFIYSTSLPPSTAAACITAIGIIDSRSVNIRKRLWKNRDMLYDGLKKLGLDTLGSETPIVPILVGDTEKALHAARYLYGNNIFAPAIRPPTVPYGKSRIRFTVSAAHTKEDIDLLLKCLRNINL